MLKMLFEHGPKPGVGFSAKVDLRKVLADARKSGVSPIELLRQRRFPHYESEDIASGLDDLFAGKDYLNVDERIMRIIDANERSAKVLRDAYRRDVLPHEKAVRRTLRGMVESKVVGEPVTLGQITADGRLFKGGAGIVGRDWPINAPGWVSPDPVVAIGYLPGRGEPGVLSVVDGKHSRALRTGRTFATDHFSNANRAVRLNRHAARLRQLRDLKWDIRPSHEIIIPGHEMKNMPWEYYLSEPQKHGQKTPVLRRVRDVAAYTEIKPTLNAQLAERAKAHKVFGRKAWDASYAQTQELTDTLEGIRRERRLADEAAREALRRVEAVSPGEAAHKAVQAVPPGDPPRTGALAKLRSVLGRLGVKGWTAAGLTAGAVGTGAGLGYHYRQNRTP